MCQACPIQFTHDHCSLGCVRLHGPRSFQIQGGTLHVPRTWGDWVLVISNLDCFPWPLWYFAILLLLTHLLNVRIPQNSALVFSSQAVTQAGPPHPVCQWLLHLSLKADSALETYALPPPPPQGCLSDSVWDWCQPPVFPGSLKIPPPGTVSVLIMRGSEVSKIKHWRLV